MCRRCRVNDQTLYVSYIGKQRKNLKMINKT